jgi:hypothetical protein
MSRDQRRANRRTQERTPTVSRRKPVRAGGEGVPWVAVATAAGIVVVVALIVYLIYAAKNGGGTSGAQAAAEDQSSSIPGTFVPDQGRNHLAFTFSEASQRPPIPFCPGVKWSGAPDGQPSGTPASGSATPGAAPSSTPQPSSSPAPASSGTAASGSPTGSANTAVATPTVPTNCRLANPPTSGPHYNVQNNVSIKGYSIRIPPDPNVYPDDMDIPRDAIPHILEHAGVFVGWNCAQDDSACTDAVNQVKDVVNNRIDVHHDRVVMSHDGDLVPGTIGMSSWNRVLDMPTSEFDKGRVQDFISTNSCRVDFEGFC